MGTEPSADHGREAGVAWHGSAVWCKKNHLAAASTRAVVPNSPLRMYSICVGSTRTWTANPYLQSVRQPAAASRRGRKDGGRSADVEPAPQFQSPSTTRQRPGLTTSHPPVRRPPAVGEQWARGLPRQRMRNVGGHEDQGGQRGKPGEPHIQTHEPVCEQDGDGGGNGSVAGRAERQDETAAAARLHSSSARTCTAAGEPE